MKKLFTLATLGLILPLSAADFRIDIIGNDKLTFVPDAVSENVTLLQAGWLGAKKDQRLNAVVKITDEWRTYSFTFIPKNSGKASLALMGYNVKSAPAACDDVRLTGSSVRNGSFEDLRPDGMPVGWWKMGSAGLVVNGDAADGRNYVVTTHNDRWTCQFDCTAGIPVTVKFSARQEGK